MWWTSGFLMGAGAVLAALAAYRWADHWQQEPRPRRPRLVLEDEPETEPDPVDSADGHTVYLDASNEQLKELISAVYAAAYPKKGKR